MRHMRRSGGYILFEAIVSMGLLSVSVIAINMSLRQALLVKAQAQDYTQARFILEEQIAEIELQPQLTETSASGRGQGDLSRFQWSYKVSRINLPEPELPPHASPLELRSLNLPAPYLAKIEVTVKWTRAGIEHEENLETLWTPQKLWVPPQEALLEPAHAQ